MLQEDYQQASKLKQYADVSANQVLDIHSKSRQLHVFCKQALQLCFETCRLMLLRKSFVMLL